VGDEEPSEDGTPRPPTRCPTRRPSKRARLITVEIKVRDDGPYKVTGPLRLIDAEGVEFDVPAGESVALCRCGHSRDQAVLRSLASRGWVLPRANRASPPAA